MSGRRSRTKGASFERFMAHAFQAMGYAAKRGIGQTRSGSEVADVEGTGYWVECKRRKRCNVQAAYTQACEATDGRPVLVVTKDDYGPVLVTMGWDEFARLGGHRE